MSPRDIGAHPPLQADRAGGASPPSPSVSAEGAHPLRVGNASLYLGNCLDILATLEPESVDSCVCDPPYHLTSIVKRFGAANAAPAQVGATGAYARASRGFMGQQWDGGDVAFRPETWEAVYRVLKPGAHLIAFSGTRTYHRMVCAIEDAGFEIRDQIGWIYGSGFPKSHDVSKQIDKLAGACRDKVVGVARGGVKPSGGFGADGTTGLSEAEKWRPVTAPATPEAEQWQGWGTALKPAWEPICLARKPLGEAGVNVLQSVESGLREQGFAGEIQWKPEPASVAAKVSSRKSSSATRAQPAAETSVANVAESGMASAAQPIESSSEPNTRNGEQPGGNTSENTTGTRLNGCDTKCSTPMAASVPVATNESTLSLPSTTSTAGVALTASPSTVKSTTNSSGRASRPATEFFAGIVTGLTGSLATVLIIRDSDGKFIWPSGLPHYAPGKALTVAANVLCYGTGALNIDATRIGGQPDSGDDEAGDSSAGIGRARTGARGNRTLNIGPVASSEPAPSGQRCLRASASLNVRRDPELLDSQCGCPACRRSDDEPPRQHEASAQGEVPLRVDVRGLHGHPPGGSDTLLNQSKAFTDTNDIDAGSRGKRPGGFGNVGAPKGDSRPNGYTPAEGRWPANIIHDGSDEVLAHFPDAPGQLVNARGDGDRTVNCYGSWQRQERSPARGDSGSAARFFYCAKTSAAERHAGCEDIEKGNSHPTVKPVDLMRYLVRLVTPKGGTVLDPFAGSGSTLIAASWEAFRSIGCELSPEYVDIARRRLTAAQKEIEDSQRQLSMFDGAEA